MNLLFVSYIICSYAHMCTQWQFDCYRINPMLAFCLLLCLADHMHISAHRFLPFFVAAFALRYDCHNYIHTFDIEFQLDWNTRKHTSAQRHTIRFYYPMWVVSFSDSGKINRINWRCTNEKLAIFCSNNDLWAASDRTVCVRVFIRIRRCLFKRYFFFKKE